MKHFDSINLLISEYETIKLRKISPQDYSLQRENPNFIKESRILLENQGYLFFRNIFPSERVKKALSVIEKALKNQNYIDDCNILSNKGVLFSGYEDITSHPDFKNLVEGKEIQLLMNSLLKGKAEKLDTKWVRVMAPGEATDLHSDFYRFAKFPYKLFTCWIPLVRQGITEGTISINELSQFLDFQNEQIPGMELPNNFLENVENGVWTHFQFEIGDLLIFDIKMVHGSFRNDSKFLRINCDTRWFIEENI